MKAGRLIGQLNFSAAAAIYERITRAAPLDSFAILMRAFCYEQQGRLQEALVLAEEGARQLPDAFVALQTAVRIAIAAKDHEKASMYVERALALPEVQSEIPRDLTPKGYVWLLRQLLKIPYFRRRVRADVFAPLEQCAQTRELQAWKRWALEYQAWRLRTEN